MFEFFSRRKNRVEIDNENIFINNGSRNIGNSIELNPVFSLSQEIPEIKVFEDNVLLRNFKIETLKINLGLRGQYLHSSIRILSNSAVMIDGIISRYSTKAPNWTDSDYEAVRFQPFYLSDKNANNLQLKGKGLFERGLHFNGTVTPGAVRNVCICDECNLSFAIQHFHAGFSEVQYFYSSDSKETLIVPYGAFENLPVQL